MRNVCCPAYSICLDDAVKAGQTFACDDCIKRSLIDPIPFEELEGMDPDEIVQPGRSGEGLFLTATGK
jgi:hypothetical protein